MTGTKTAAAPSPIGELAARLAARFVFVVGKGGVGKTTTAGALALALADGGRATHLISTDSAHSLGDLFETRLGSGEPAPCRCTPRLLLEEFDGPAYASRWFERVAGPLAEVVERGTYLDAPDAGALIELSLAGIDEVAAAWRLADLADADGADRIVVDTAPTGHLLRLLDAGALARGWVDALDAMADKAATVASGLTGRPVRFAAEEVADEIRRRAERWDDGLLRTAAFVVVTRPEPVIRAETRRLVGALERRGLHVAATLAVGGESAEPPARPLPVRPDARGCEPLRALARAATHAEAPAASARTGTGGRHVATSGEDPAAPADPADPAERTPDDDDDRSPGAASPVAGWLVEAGFEWHFFAGKGGVGKTTCATACALALARRRRVALFGTDPAGSLGDVLDARVPADGLRIGDRLEVRRLDAAAELARFRRRYRAEIERVVERAGLDRAAFLDRRVVEWLLGLAPPGIDEVIAFAGMLELADRHDAVVVDAAPTGHFLRLLALPDVALDWIHALMRVLLELRSVAGLDETAERLLRLARRVKALRGALTDPARTAVVVVTGGGPLVASETRRLRAALERAGLPVAAVLRNRVAGDAAVAASGGDGPRPRSTISAERSGRAGRGSVGAARARERAEPAPRLLYAPGMSAPPAGRDALLRFLERWEMRA